MVEDALELEAVRRMVLESLTGIEAGVYLFGSRARGDARPASDVDVAVDPASPLPVGLLAELRERLEDSDVPYVVDVVDLSETDAAFAARVRSEGIAWT